MFQTRLPRLSCTERAYSKRLPKAGRFVRMCKQSVFPYKTLTKWRMAMRMQPLNLWTFEPVNGHPLSKAVSVHHFPPNCSHFYPCPIHKVKEGNASLPVYLLTSYKNNDELMRLSENEIFFPRSRKAKIITTPLKYSGTGIHTYKYLVTFKSVRMGLRID